MATVGVRVNTALIDAANWNPSSLTANPICEEHQNEFAAIDLAETDIAHVVSVAELIFYFGLSLKG
jgi:hypothetical protein